MKIDYKKFDRKTWLMLGSGMALLVLILILAVATASRAGAGVYPTFMVQKGPLTISVSERGTIRARQQEVIKCRVEGQTTIIYLVEEGTPVKKGDLLVELDSSKLQDTKVNQQIQVQNAEANFIRARENLEVVKNQAKADVAKATLDSQFAKEDLRQYDEGEYPNVLRAAESKITIANEELERAREKLRWTKVLFNEKYVSQTELQADVLSEKKSALDLEQARAELKLLQEYTYKRKVDELKSNVDQTTMALERAIRKSAADLAQAEADLTAKQSEFQRQNSQLDKTLRQIESCKMISPTDGLVVYATTGQGGGFRGSQEPLDEGATVRERQDLIYLPTATDMMAEVKIHESNLDKIRVGLPVVISVDAIPGKSLTGRVSRIAPLPDATSMWMNPDLKVYNTEITIDGDGSALKTGMSCHAQIIVENYPDSLFVPIQAVVRDRGQPVVYVMNGNKPQRREIEVGLDNNDRVRVLSGVKEGEIVWAAPPIPDAGNGNGNQVKVAADLKVPPPSTRPVSPRTTAPSSLAQTRPTTGPAGAPGAIDWRNMTDEQRAEARKRLMESMTPEQRQAFEERRRQGGGGGPGGPGGPGGGGRRNREPQ